MHEDAARDNSWAVPDTAQVQSPQLESDPVDPVDPAQTVRPDALPPSAAPSQQPDVAVAEQREPHWRVLGVVVLAALLLAAGAAISSSSGRTANPTSYSVQSGSAAGNPAFAFPNSIDSLQYITPDGSPLWKQYPKLLPTSPSETFGTVTASYYDNNDQAVFNVDAVYAVGSGANGAVFSLGPASMLTVVANSLYMADFKQYPAGTAGVALGCGTYALSPLCVWADRSTLMIVDDYGTPSSSVELANVTREINTGIEK